MPTSDSDIIAKVSGGAKRQFALLVDRYKDRAMTLAVRMLKNREDAEEATQDAFIRAYNALDKFEGKAQFGTWFYRILYNVCLTKLGKRKDEFASIEYDDEQGYEAAQKVTFLGGISEQKVTSDSEFETGDLILFVKKIIEKLPDKYGTILSMFYFQELSHAEICEVTQLPLGTVKIHLFRARTLLQEQLKKELQPERVFV